MPISGLWLPPSAEEKAQRKVRVCLLCGRRFSEEQATAWMNHVTSCSNTDRAQSKMEEIVALKRDSIFTHVADEERYAHMRRQAAARKETNRK